jgi:putative DNA primase/helicase
MEPSISEIEPLPEPEKPKPIAGQMPPNLTVREQIGFRLLGELRYSSEQDGYFCRCPNEGLHTNTTADKHTILYLNGVPTLECMHASCSYAVEAFNWVLRSEIGKVEFKPPLGKNREEPPPEIPWIDILTKAAVTAAELSALHIAPRKKILGEWFCEADLGFFFGPRGAGKTWFTLGVVQAVTTAGTFGDWKAPEAIKVLYVDGEMPPDSMQARCEGLKAINDNLVILNHSILFDRTDKTMNITNHLIQDGLTSYCLNNSMRVLVLDNLSTLGVGMKENDADSWEMVNAWLLHLRKRGVAVVIIHHSGRSGHMRGTSRREDNVFWIIAIDDIRKDSEETIGAKFTTRFTKQSRNTPNEIPGYEWHFEPDMLTGLTTVTHKVAQTLTVFRSVVESGVTNPGQIARVMRIEDYQVSRMAHKAIGEGWLERVNRGEYAIVAGK